MKTYLKIVVASVIVGGFLAYLFYHDINKEVIALEQTGTTLYLFQVGVFTNATNAENFASNFDSSLIYDNEDFYRVLTCATLDNKEKMQNFYEKNEINYYIKKITINENFQKELEASDTLLKKASEKEAIFKLCQNELDIFALYQEK